MVMFKAKTTYGDYEGTASIDNADVNRINSYITKNNLIKEKHFIIGFDMYCGEVIDKKHFDIVAYYFDDVDNFEDAKKIIDSGSNLSVRKVEFKIPTNTLMKLFKRFSIAVHPNGLDITGRELSVLG